MCELNSIGMKQCIIYAKSSVHKKGVMISVHSFNDNFNDNLIERIITSCKYMKRKFVKKKLLSNSCTNIYFFKKKNRNNVT